MGDKWKTSVNSCGPRYRERETSVKIKLSETSVNCKLMRPKATEREDRCKLMRPKAPRVDLSPETEAKSCGPGMQPLKGVRTPYR